MKNRHWDSLVRSLKLGKCILILGSEIEVSYKSSGKGEPIRMDNMLLTNFASELAKELKDEGAPVNGKFPLAIAQQYVDTLGLGSINMRSKAEEYYSHLEWLDNPVFDSITELPFKLILTTRHDDCLHDNFQKRNKTPEKHVYNYKKNERDNNLFPDANDADHPLIYHLFGHYSEAESMVLSENDVLDLLVSIVSENPPLPNSLIRQLKQDGHCFLFFGIGIKQWYLRVLWKVLVRALDLNISGNGFVNEQLGELPNEDRSQTILFYQRGHNIEISDCTMDKFLADLKVRLGDSPVSVSSVEEKPPRPRVFLSYVREDEAMAKRIYKNLKDDDFGVWMDLSKLEVGVNYSDDIPDEIASTDFFVLLYSNNMKNKHESYAHDERKTAADRARRINGEFLIPVIIDQDCDTVDFPEFKNIIHKAVYEQSFDENVRTLKSSLIRNYQRNKRLA